MKTYIVDSFTNTAFKGNPAGVCLAESPLEDSLMQSVASELGFSETAFVATGSNSGRFSIRYFSPKMEIPLCGHATLAASKVLFHNDHSLKQIEFVTGHGVKLQILIENDGSIVMRFPVYDVQEANVPDELLAAIGVTDPIDCAYNEETNIILLEIANTDLLAALNPDFEAMLNSHSGIHGVLVTARCAHGVHDFHSRFFWPWSGGTEDPVTGATHTFLTKYWSDRLGKTSLRSFQSSARTGEMEVELVSESELLIKAHAKIILAGNWVVDESPNAAQSNEQSTPSMNSSNDQLLHFAHEASLDYWNTLNDRPVFPREQQLAALSSLKEKLPETSSDPLNTLSILRDTVAPATVATTGGRFFGFVVGGALPVTIAANWMASTWDQNAGSWILAPSVIELESIAAEWLLEVLDLPRESAVGFVTGSTMGTFSAIAVARSALLNRLGHDVKQKGLAGSPPLRIVTSEETHPTNLAALGYAGIGTEQVEFVPSDERGRLIVDDLPSLDDRTIVMLQAGNINSGDFDPFLEACRIAREAGAWVHVDGAFGLWARASKSKRQFTEGIELADSWCVDGHKWLNLPQDSAVYICRDHQAVADVFATNATYLMRDNRRQPSNFVPELSRRARGVEFWAALKTLGRSGVEQLVNQCCDHASHLAKGLESIGFEILNEVVLNQIVFSCETPQQNDTVCELLQSSGVLWLGPTTWKSRRALRISISSWATNEQDIQIALDVLQKAFNARTATNENVPR